MDPAPLPDLPDDPPKGFSAEGLQFIGLTVVEVQDVQLVKGVPFFLRLLHDILEEVIVEEVILPSQFLEVDIPPSSRLTGADNHDLYRRLLH